jgi:hypothetical protein
MEKTKVCRKCGKEKPVSEFYKQKIRKDGLYPFCKSCARKEQQRYKHSLNGTIHRIYNSQKRSSKKRGHKPPAYTFDELANWIIHQPNFKKLWKAWKNSGYKKDLTLSVDRLDNSKGYSFDNIRLVSWYENNYKGWQDQKQKVNQYDLDGNYIRTFDSIAEAAEYMGKSYTPIINACAHRYKTAYNYQWRYLSEEPTKTNIGKIIKRVRKVKATLPSGEELIFNSLSEAGKYFNCSHTTINRKIKNRTKFPQLKDVKLEYLKE